MKEIPVPQNEQTFEQWWDLNKYLTSYPSNRSSKDIARRAWNAALSQPVPQEIENEQSGISGELEPMPEEFVFDPYMYDADDGEIIRYKTAEEMIAEVVRVASETNELQSQPVPQGEQSLPPQLVPDEWLTALVIHGGACGPDIKAMAKELQQLRAYVSKLQTELLDTKRALELACDELGNQVDECLEKARNERKGQQNG